MRRGKRNQRKAYSQNSPAATNISETSNRGPLAPLNSCHRREPATAPSQSWRSRVETAGWCYGFVVGTGRRSSTRSKGMDSIWASTVLTGFRLQEPFVQKRYPCLFSYDAVYSQILVLLVVLDRRSRGRAKLAILDQDWKAPRWLSMS
jgi:hypothetical protein